MLWAGFYFYTVCMDELIWTYCSSEMAHKLLIHQLRCSCSHNSGIDSSAQYRALEKLIPNEKQFLPYFESSKEQPRSSGNRGTCRPELEEKTRADPNLAITTLALAITVITRPHTCSSNCIVPVEAAHEKQTRLAVPG